MCFTAGIREWRESFREFWISENNLLHNYSLYAFCFNQQQAVARDPYLIWSLPDIDLGSFPFQDTSQDWYA